MKIRKKNIKENKIKKPSIRCENFKNKISNLLSYPSDLIGQSTRMAIVDNKYVLIEGKNQIEDYYTHYIKIKTSLTTIIIDGRNLVIKNLNPDELLIEGDILNVTYAG